MKSPLTIFGLMVLASALFCTVAQAQKTSAGFDSNANFSSYKTFTFDKSGARNPFVNKMIVAAVERELTARGLTKVVADPDLVVVYLAASGPCWYWSRRSAVSRPAMVPVRKARDRNWAVYFFRCSSPLSSS